MPNFGGGGTHGAGGQLGAVQQQYGTTPRTGSASLPDPEQPDANGVKRLGRGYDNYNAMIANPNAGNDQTPQWNANAGPYGAYLNRLQLGAATPGAAGTAASDTAIQGMQAGPRTNAPAQAAQAQADQSRAMQLGGIANVQNAGSDFRGAQAGMLGGGSAQSLIDSGSQRMMSAMATRADLTSAQNQGTAMDLYKQAALGQGPSAAQAQLRSGIDQSIAAQHALAAGVRGGGAAAAARQAGQMGQQMNMQAAQQAAALRAQEQQAGMAGLANTSMQGRTADQARAALQSDILGQKRAGDTAFLNAGGQIAGTARAQDIGQAGQVQDYLGQLRGQDIAAGGTFGGLANQQMAIDDARRNAAMQAGLESERLRQMGLSGQNADVLNAAGLMSNNYLQGRQMTLAHDQAQDQQFAQGLGAITGGAGSLLQGAMPLFSPTPSLGGGYGVGPSVDAALASFDNAHQQPGMF